MSFLSVEIFYLSNFPTKRAIEWRGTFYVYSKVWTILESMGFDSMNFPDMKTFKSYDGTVTLIFQVNLTAGVSWMGTKDLPLIGSNWV